MKTYRKLGLVIAAMGLIAAAPAVDAVPFTITTATFSPGTGYGFDASESAGSASLLDVRFSTASFAAQDFVLTSVGETFSFVFGSVDFQEPSSNGGIAAAETDDLGVIASFVFTNPLGASQAVNATGTATAGSVSDSAVDYTLVWDAESVPFGSGGLFGISLSSLSFSVTGIQTQLATITLLSPSEEIAVEDIALVAVPEPVTLTLLGVGLLGFAASRRRAARHDPA